METLLLFQQGLAFVKLKIRLKLRRFLKRSVQVGCQLNTDFLMKFCWPRNVVLWTGIGGGEKLRYELQLQMWGRVENVSEKKCFSSVIKTCLFLIWPTKGGKSGKLMKSWTMRCLRRIIPVPSFFLSPLGSKNFTSSWLRRRLRITFV